MVMDLLTIRNLLICLRKTNRLFRYSSLVEFINNTCFHSFCNNGPEGTTIIAYISKRQEPYTIYDHKLWSSMIFNFTPSLYFYQFYLLFKVNMYIAFISFKFNKSLLPNIKYNEIFAEFSKYIHLINTISLLCKFYLY